MLKPWKPNDDDSDLICYEFKDEAIILHNNSSFEIPLDSFRLEIINESSSLTCVFNNNHELLPEEDFFLNKSKADKPGRSNYIYLKNLEYSEQSIIKLISNKVTYTLKHRSWKSLFPFSYSVLF